jgi:hypothetical protein
MHGNHELWGFRMSEQDEVIQNILVTGTTDLRELIDDMGCSLELTVAEVMRFGPFLSRAWVAGAKAFQTEMVARSIEAESKDEFPFGPTGSRADR